MDLEEELAVGGFIFVFIILPDNVAVFFLPMMLDVQHLSL